MNKQHKYNLIGSETEDSDIDIFNARGATRRRLPEKSSSKSCKILVCCFVSVLVITVLIMGIIHFHQRLTVTSSGASTTTQTQCGLVAGVAEYVDANNQYGYSFKGIPYALPPVGNLRWRSPIPLSRDKNTCWNGTFNADRFPSKCVQGNEGSEDCLYLNVWTPSLTKLERLPVFVWIHGGYLMNGHGNEVGYSPDSEFVTLMNVVAVSMNYRLNAFGFLTLKELWHRNESYGNYGIMDQILVLKWIRDNIENFGGDPNSVTIVGQSSGATSIFGILASPLADGLFIRAIPMSGSPKFEKSYIDASKENRIFINNSKCNSSSNITECLYKLSAKQVTDSMPVDVYPTWSMTGMSDFPKRDKFFGALVVIEPAVIPISPKQVSKLNYTSTHKVSVLFGSTAHETGMAPEYSFNHTYGVTDHLHAYIKKRLDEFSPNFTNTVFQLYKNSTDENGQIITNKTTNFWFDTMTTDVRVTCPINVLMANISKSPHFDTYRYIMSYSLKTEINMNTIKMRNAFHTLDAFALFNFKIVKDKSIYNITKSDWEFSKSIRKVFRAFVKDGKLTDNWPKWGEKRTGIFGGDGKVYIQSYHEKQCRFWSEPTNGFIPYSWIN